MARRPRPRRGFLSSFPLSFFTRKMNHNIEPDLGTVRFLKPRVLVELGAGACCAAASCLDPSPTGLEKGREWRAGPLVDGLR